MRFTTALAVMSVPSVAFAPVATGQWHPSDRFVVEELHDPCKGQMSLALEGWLTLIGCPEHKHDGKKNMGAVFVWDSVLDRPLLEISDPAGKKNDRFGHSVVLENGLAIIGAPGQGVGRVQVFDALTGAKRLELTPPGGGGKFGWSLAAADGRLYVGAPWNNLAEKNAGAVFAYDMSTWTLVNAFFAVDAEEDDQLGYEIAAGGGRLAATALHASTLNKTNPYSSQWGAIYAFDSNTGMQQGKVDPGTFHPSMYKASMAIEGDTLLFGAPSDWVANTDAGIAYVYDLASGDELVQLTEPEPFWYHEFGAAVALDDRTAIVAASGFDGGVLYFYDRDTWELEQVVSAPPAETSFGRSLSLDGPHLVAGFLNVPGQGVGAHALVRCPLQRFCSPAKPNSKGGRARIEALGCSLSGGAALRGMFLPAFEPALLLVGAGRGTLLPPGSDGRLCLVGSAPAIGVYSDDLTSVDPFGLVETDLVHGATGGGSGRLPVQIGGALEPGATWNFQYWYRDEGSSNFSDAIAVAFVR